MTGSETIVVAPARLLDRLRGLQETWTSFCGRRGQTQRRKCGGKKRTACERLDVSETANESKKDTAVRSSVGRRLGRGSETTLEIESADPGTTRLVARIC